MNRTYNLLVRIQTLNHLASWTSLLVNGYKYGSFDVESSFTNVLIKKTMLYSHEYVMTILSVQISKGVHSKKLILDTCTKTAFSFNNNIICKQKDGVSMGSSLGPIIPSRPNPGRSEKN